MKPDLHLKNALLWLYLIKSRTAGALWERTFHGYDALESADGSLKKRKQGEKKQDDPGWLGFRLQGSQAVGYQEQISDQPEQLQEVRVLLGSTYTGGG